LTKGTREKNRGLGNPFSNFTPQARFLFGQQVEKYLSDATTKWIRLHGIEGEIGGAGVRAVDYAEQRQELLGWFEAQAKTGVKELFAPYLDFEKWK
jgi:predicted DNA-binding ArsR family transcriptional regulator